MGLIGSAIIGGGIGGGGPAITLTARHWRVFITANGGDNSFTGIIEIDFRETVGGTNLTVDGTNASSSSRHLTFIDDKAFDGSLASTDGWIVGFTGNPLPAWIAYDFGAEQLVQEILIGSYSTSSLTNERSVKDFLIQNSPDGVEWTTILEVTNQTGWTFGDQRAFELTS